VLFILILFVMKSLTLKSYIEQVESWKINPFDIVWEFLDRAEKDSDDLHAFVRLHPDYVEKNLNDFKDLPLHWAPIGVKDNIMTKWYISSVGSKMLENYVAPYSATCFERLQKQW
jgi:aspartyl-tRNA(Asn)/glutamyl-tRNA(Gln) amidotransferase subunit A